MPAEFGEETLNDDEVTIISSVLECVLLSHYQVRSRRARC